jgi:hypothetical protein
VTATPSGGSIVGWARGVGRWLARWPGWFIAGFVVLQLALPLHYYCGRRDQHDERFAWRMFSPTRMVRCELTMTIDDAAVDIDREFHQAWLALAARGRRAVIEAMGHHLCQRHPKTAVVARARCTPLRGEPYLLGGFDLCTIPQL